MAKQTFTTGQVLTASQMSDLQQTAMTGGAASTKTVSYVLVAADAGTRVAMNAAGSTTITVNTGLFSAGDTVSIQNIGAGVCTVTAGTATVNTSGSLVLAQYQGGILYFTSASAAIFFQFATPASGDIEGVTAGTGISGGGTSGTVTITNSMATEITAAGDIVVGTGNATFDNLPIGSTGQVLTADTTVSPYKVKWAAPAAGGGMTLISETVASALSSLSFSSLGSYKQLVLMYSGIRHSDNASSFVVRLNNDSGTNYYKSGMSGQGSTLRLGADALTHLGDSNNATWCAFGVGTNYGTLDTDVMGYIVIDNYTSSTKGKAVFAAFSYYNAGAGGGYYAQSLNHFVNITSAITSIDVVRLTGTGTFSNTANTTIRLYGVN